MVVYGTAVQLRKVINYGLCHTAAVSPASNIALAVIMLIATFTPKQDSEEKESEVSFKCG